MALTKIPPSGINIAALTNELGGGTTVYSTIAGLPLSGNDPGSMAFVSENNRLYIWNGTGWFNIALINTSPTITAGPSASYEFTTDGTPTIITLAAQDPEGLPVTWSYQVTSGTLGNTATITQNSNVFTITPSTSSVDAGTFGITFTASDGVNLATATSAFELTFGPPAIGQAFGGGFYAGQISTTQNGVATHYLVVGPKSTAETSTLTEYSTESMTTYASSVIDGPQNANTSRIISYPSSYPAFLFCNNVVAGGFNDWYLPAIRELQVLYYNLKPTTATNSVGRVNEYAVPRLYSTYTSSTPAKTSATLFKEGNAQAFESTWYWSSTENSYTRAWKNSFQDGSVNYTGYKSFGFRVRAVRRIPV